MERIDPALLGRLRFVTRRRRQGGWGERRSTRRGQGLEFADYRDYVPGDDLRRVDWNLLARLDRPYVRLYEEEADLHIHLLLDASASMVWGEGAAARWPKALALTLALGTIALLGGEAFDAVLLRDGALDAPTPPLRGRAALPRWERWIGAATAAGETALADSVRRFLASKPRPGLAVLISDGYDPQGLTEGIKRLAAQGQEVVLLHLLTPEELEPPLWGEVRLVDVERGTTREVTVDRAAQAAYAARLERWQAQLRDRLGRYGGRYCLVRSDLPLRQMVLEVLRRASVVR